jgi:hypothetical protein
MNAVAEQTINAQTVVEAVQKRLQDRHPDGVNLEALPQGVRHEQDWWYVSVRPDKEPAKDWEYFEALAEVEMEMLTQENILVLILPTPAGQ